MEYQILAARPEDLPLLGSIEAAAAQLLRGHAPQSVLDAVTEASAFREAQAAGRLWVALAGERPVGFALVEMLGEESPHLAEIDVHPQHGGRGLGNALVRTVCEWVSASGYGEITLTTFREVPWNMPFYSRLGFTAIPEQELSPELAELVRLEAMRGLDPMKRVVMRCHLPRRGSV